MRWHAALLLALLGGAACRRAPPALSVDWVPGKPDHLIASADHRMLLRSWADHFDVVDAAGQVTTRGEPGERAIGAPDGRGRVVALQPGGDVLDRDRKLLTKLSIPPGASVIAAADGDTCVVVWRSDTDRTTVAAFSCTRPGSPVVKTLEQPESLATATAGHIVLAGTHADASTLTVLDTRLDTISTAALPGTPAAIAAGDDAGRLVIAIAGADRLHPPRFFTTSVPTIALSELASEQPPRSIVAGCDVTALAPGGKHAWLAACAQRDHTGKILFSYVVHLDAAKQLAVSDALIGANESTSWITDIAIDAQDRILVTGVKAGDRDAQRSSN